MAIYGGGSSYPEDYSSSPIGSDHLGIANTDCPQPAAIRRFERGVKKRSTAGQARLFAGESASEGENSKAVCVFCKIAAGGLASVIVFEDEASIAFLDRRPVFLGHSLLIPREHYETFADLPRDLLPQFFANAQALSRAVEVGTRADGTFVAMNNRVSQSVPHLHVHVVPRIRGDGLRGFFWPRRKYENEAQMNEFRDRIHAALKR
jgi:histidine triad (HIT) family protein